MFGRQAAKEPEEGSWIWLPDAERRDNLRVFFRREFVAPADADVFQLQISALPFYHVYLNGEHVGYGPSAATHTKCYVDSYDVTQYLTPGINTLGLVDRAIILLWLEGLSYEEIGAIVGISVKNVSFQLHRIKDELKKSHL